MTLHKRKVFPTNDDGILSQAEWETYEKYRQAVLSAWMGSENFLITLALTQYDKVLGGNVLQTYEAQVDFVAEILPSIGIGNIELDYGNIDF